MSETSKALSGILGVFGFLALSTCVMIGTGPKQSNESAEAAEAAIAADDQVMMENMSVADLAPPPMPLKATGETKQPKQIKMSDLPPMDDIDKMIGAVINLNGYLCARPIEVREAGGGLYGVRCITRRDGTGISDYLVNSRTNEVEAI